VRRGLVFAGGYVAGVAWELGVLRGLQDVNADLLSKVIAADVVVGTSAGCTVAVEITSGTAIDVLYAAQLSEIKHAVRSLESIQTRDLTGLLATPP
jgi:NTE family protein